MTRERGTLLLDALCALALVGLAAAGGAGLVHVAAVVHAEAGRLDRATSLADGLRLDLAAVSFRRLPAVFGADAGDAAATLDTADGTAPPGWHERVAALPRGRAEARLDALGRDAVATTMSGAVALRVTVRVSWAERGAVRRVELVDVRT